MSENVSRNIAICEKLKQIRLDKGLNQKEFSTLLGVKQSYYSELENGKREITTRVLSELAVKLKISLDWFLFNKGSMNIADRDISHVANSIEGIDEELFIREGEATGASFDLVKNLIKSNGLKTVNDENEDINSTLTLCKALLDNYSIENRSLSTSLGYNNKKTKYNDVLAVFKDAAKIAIELNEVISPYKKTIEELYKAIQAFDDSHDRLFRYEN